MKSNKVERDEFLKHLGEKLKDIRVKRGLSQEALAQEAGFSRSYYTEIELGKRNISIVNLYKLSKCIRVSLKELLNFDITEAK